MQRYLVYTILFGLGILLLAQCSKLNKMRKAIAPPTPHEQYARSLRAAELDNTTMGQTWLTESKQALKQPVSINTPFHEVGYFDPRQPTAVAYQLQVKRGRSLIVRVEPQQNDSAQYFVDLFRTTANAADSPEHVTSARDSLRIELEVNHSGTYIIRVQPELLRGGRFTIAVLKQSSLTFPVAERDSRAIQSVFGDPREGGNREHHGVDIFAPRGTPAVAAADGYVHRIGNSRLGGKVIWMRDENRRQTYYYAHLDSQIVRQSGPVNAGDTLGLIGNTGNARHTPPHLHFGIYSRGPIDPYPFVDNIPRNLPTVTTDTLRLGSQGRITGQLVNIRSGPSTREDILQQMPRHTLFEYQGANHGWYRIRFPDGTTGYIADYLTEKADSPVNRLSEIDGRYLLHEPQESAAILDSLGSDVQAEVLGTYKDFVFARTPTNSGWMLSPHQ